MNKLSLNPIEVFGITYNTLAFSSINRKVNDTGTDGGTVSCKLTNESQGNGQNPMQEVFNLKPIVLTEAEIPTTLNAATLGAVLVEKINTTSSVHIALAN